MPFEIQANDRIIRLILAGHVTEADGVELVHELARVEEKYEVFPDRLVDFSAVEKSDFDYETIARRAEERRTRVYPNQFRLAMVAPKPLDYGCARIYQTLCDNPQVELQIFKTRAEAEAWLATNV
jgi:hypothetical protein